jgi:cytochrome c oxidase cbb3-type subunit IV
VSGSLYTVLRHFADSWGLLAMTMTFLVLIGWALRPSVRSAHEDAATSIFRDDDHDI